MNNTDLTLFVFFLLTVNALKYSFIRLDGVTKGLEFIQAALDMKWEYTLTVANLPTNVFRMWLEAGELKTRTRTDREKALGYSILFAMLSSLVSDATDVSQPLGGILGHRFLTCNVKIFFLIKYLYTRLFF